MEHELILIGSRINHLPAAVFHLYSIVQTYYAGQYEETGDAELTYHKERNVYESETAVMTPLDTTVCVAYEEGEEPGRYTYTVRLKAATGQQYALRMPCSTAFLQQYYYPVRRFLRANPAKYIRPGTSRRPKEGTTIAVLDTEMQRPYITQFAGVLLRYHDGAFEMCETERLNVYVRLPEGVRMDPYVQKVTGLTCEFLNKNGVEEDEALDLITEFLSAADLVCGHAVLSDIELLRERYLLAGRIPDPSVLTDAASKDLAIASLAAAQDVGAESGTDPAGAVAYYQPEPAAENTDNQIPACLLRSDLIDTQVLMEFLYDLQGMIKLERAAELAGVVDADDVFHDARTDADVTARLLIKLWPKFVARFHVMPIVKAAMMHAPKDTVLLNTILGKSVPVKDSDAGNGRSKSARSRKHTTAHNVRRTIRTEQRRKRIT